MPTQAARAPVDMKLAISYVGTDGKRRPRLDVLLEAASGSGHSGTPRAPRSFLPPPPPPSSSSSCSAPSTLEDGSADDDSDRGGHDDPPALPPPRPKKDKKDKKEKDTKDKKGKKFGKKDKKNKDKKKCKHAKSSKDSDKNRGKDKESGKEKMTHVEKDQDKDEGTGYSRKRKGLTAFPDPASPPPLQLPALQDITDDHHDSMAHAAVAVVPTEDGDDTQDSEETVVLPGHVMDALASDMMRMSFSFEHSEAQGA